MSKEIAKPIEIPKGELLHVIPTKIQAMMGGVNEIIVSPMGEVRLVYTDGTSEIGSVPKDKNMYGFWGMIDHVQGQNK